ncbi:hypothetical protein PHLCEN_2v9044 [Hermanssonia centrifuga]|uniref:Putative gamma-glutamylcyclotransferase n=1 Tax=Hermanssonia centrifuga TaxID=98765 RepID=A0A2R6NRU7_9APHY|nr:hypothetical protein PHLCEN_2v9044 [Hermanssonia centrifuga]
MASTYSAFFYGTLLHPSILRRVIGHHGTELEICPALLLHADYPGVIPYSKTKELVHGKELSYEDRAVRGTLVRGLSEKDVSLLDIFEGDEYTREIVSVHPLAEFTPLSSADTSDSSIVPTTPPPIPPLSSLSSPLTAHTYIWAKPLSQLRPELWEYAEFVRTNAWKWVGDGSRDNKDYVEVDKRREMGGVIVRTEIVKEPGQDEKVMAEKDNEQKME